MFDLTTRDIKYLQGVGPQRATLLNKELEIHSLHDLLYYFPYKYVDRSRLYYIHEIDGNMPYIQLKGQILSFETVGEGRQRRLVAHFSDGTGVVDLVWFQGTWKLFFGVICFQGVWSVFQPEQRNHPGVCFGPVSRLVARAVQESGPKTHLCWVWRF